MRITTLKEIAVDVLVEIAQDVLDRIDPLTLAGAVAEARGLAEDEELELAALFDTGTMEIEVSWDE